MINTPKLSPSQASPRWVFKFLKNIIPEVSSFLNYLNIFPVYIVLYLVILLKVDIKQCSVTRYYKILFSWISTSSCAPLAYEYIVLFTFFLNT